MTRSISPILLAGIPALISCIACNPAGMPARGEDRFAVIAYVSGRGRTTEAVPVEKLTHVIYSFLHLKGSSLAINGPRDSAAIDALVALKLRNPHLRVMLSLGGWGGCATCSEVFATSRGRREFAESALRVLSETRTDGLDIDWEYPAVEGYPGHRYAEEDAHNFTLLMKELRETLGAEYELSFAAGGFSACLRASIEWQQVMPVVNRVNVMTYDLVNADSKVTGHQTALFSSPVQRESADNAVRMLDSLGVKPEKIVIGSAFYARVWGDVADTDHGLFQTGRFVRFIPYRDLDGFLKGTGGFRPFWDSASQAPYSYSAEKKMFATYDDRRSVALKTEYALERHLGGIMFWELTGDAPAGGLLEAIDSTRASVSRSR
ncbi:MAG TPA: glycoside hydrolase family 18 protein [Bacteroidota bacterium]|nr:glycoside hydrolase family 18 protein [Bacteroidota bacterium]